MPHIPYVDPASVTDPEILGYLERARREGTPRPESQAIRANNPSVIRAFSQAWELTFRQGVCDHAIKELCRVYVSRSVKCEYCGNQRSEKARAQGLGEAQYDDLLNFEKSEQLSDREKAALAYAEAITWRLESSDALWERLYRHFSEPELVELGCFIALTMGQQSWLRLLDNEHHEVLAGTSASMAPGFGTAEELAASKAAPDYWADEAAT